MMRYIPNTDADRHAMLQTLGLSAIDELFSGIPQELRYARPLDIPKALSEQDVLRHMRTLANRNANVEDFAAFLGAGAYHHFIPSIVPVLTARGEFMTAYTPYQPEMAQGTLQAVYEYQTLICQLTDMEVANASLYDGSTGVAEAVLMARRVTQRDEVLVSEAVHPEYRAVLRTYLQNLGMQVREISVDAAGQTPLPQVRQGLSAQTACLVVQSPNFFGVIEDLTSFAETLHAQKALLVQAIAEPVSLGLLKPPGAWGADIVVGEGQAFGNTLSYGGPYLGFFATRDHYVRQMPGRLAGETVDTEGRRGYVLTLSTREQHIRREKATSNICTNEGLCALAATIHLCTLGKIGLRQLAELNVRRATHARQQLAAIPGCRVLFSGPTFNEFVLETPKLAGDLIRQLSPQRLIPGIDLGRFYPARSHQLLICVTEMNSRQDIDRLGTALATAVRS
ncbi:MAG TPA: aminomethyl-transferring glycine dehydrogenase subunit GcvPA [Candidatus Tectomicrobia bacterium]|nr:aminomethyl-transferring glycine dehydrogenase subunit GcvPA [Candidatus Tectomicrobia bacterium]